MAHKEYFTLKDLNAGLERIHKDVVNVDRVEKVKKVDPKIQKTTPCIPPVGQMRISPLRRI
jgi:hypothetical protein